MLLHYVLDERRDTTVQNRAETLQTCIREVFVRILAGIPPHLRIMVVLFFSSSEWRGSTFKYSTSSPSDSLPIHYSSSTKFGAV